MQREYEIQQVLKAVINANVDSFDNPNGGYENTCPFCCTMTYGNYNHPWLDMHELTHDMNCAYIIAKGLMTGK